MSVDVHGRLRRLLEERGWTEYRLSKESGLLESTLANIFKRNASPSIPTVQAICEGFGITLSQFLRSRKWWSFPLSSRSCSIIGLC
ncbi:MAG: helix-turn-helix transcriptional regulator [Candidatus Limiplasma sp.]|nr:helix-turn-helix transcriptional regulator [Candidatus Limiplasma sp.]